MQQFVCLLVLALLMGGSVYAAEDRGFHRTKLQATTQSGEPLALYAQSHALLIGVSEYTHWPRLSSIPHELDQVEQALKEQDFNVVRLNNPKGRELSNGIEDFINEYGYERENRLLIYFSGHGHSIGEKGFLLPADTPLPDSKGFRRETVPMSRVMSWARDMEAKHALFLFDSCFSGSVFKSRNLPQANSRYIRKVTAEPVRQFITAGDANEVVPAKSTFTPALVRAIKGEGDLNEDGYITGSELGVHLSQLVPQYVEQTPQYGKIRDYDLAQGDFVFFTQNTQPAEHVANVPEQSLDTLFWQSAERGNTIEEYQAYLDRYPEGAFTRLARSRIARLKQNLAPIKEESPTQPTVATTGTLTVKVDPPDARVRIMNIEPHYQDGIELALNEHYDILVSRDGYQNHRQWVTLTRNNQVESIALTKIKSRLDFPPPDRHSNAEAFKRYQECASGYGGSCATLAKQYFFGEGVDVNVNRAVDLLHQSCNLGNFDGCNELAYLYTEGEGVTKDLNKAIALFERACEGGLAFGCLNMGVVFSDGLGGKVDTSRAAAFYQQACDLGEAEGCTRAKVLR